MTTAASFDVSERIRAITAIAPGADAVELDGRQCTWGDLAAARDGLAQSLGRAGAGDGARIGLVMRNRLGMVAALLAALGDGFSVVSLSHLGPMDRLVADVRSLGLAAVVADAGDWADPAFTAAVRGAGLLGIRTGHDPARVEVVVRSGLPADEMVTRTSPGVAVSMLTSGTTGPPKRVPVTYRNLAASFRGAAHYESGGTPPKPRLRSGVAIVVAPILHTSGLFRLLLNVLEGRRVALLEKFDVDGMLRLVHDHDARVLALTPTSIRMILDADVAPAELATVRVVISGTAPLDPAVAEEFEDTYDVAVLVMYGATEFAGGIAGWTLPDRQRYRASKRGSVGRVHPGVEVRTRVPGTGETTAPGVAGQLDVRAAQVATDGPDGWQATTDLARIDSDGFLWILGRTDDVIIRGGFKVSTGAVAEILKRHPSVRDAAVVGLPDDRLGQVPVAAVESTAGTTFQAAELISWLRERVAPYEVPTSVVEFDQLPRTPSLKVSHERLTELLDSSPDAG